MAVRDAQHSSDGFWTIDIRLAQLVILDRELPVTDKFIRLEVEPGTEAHQFMEKQRIRNRDSINLEGPVLIDRDGPFLEIHPTRLTQ